MNAAVQLLSKFHFNEIGCGTHPPPIVGERAAALVYESTGVRLTEDHLALLSAFPARMVTGATYRMSHADPKVAQRFKGTFATNMFYGVFELEESRLFRFDVRAWALDLGLPKPFSIIPFCDIGSENMELGISYAEPTVGQVMLISPVRENVRGVKYKFIPLYGSIIEMLQCMSTCSDEEAHERGDIR